MIRLHNAMHVFPQDFASYCTCVYFAEMHPSTNQMPPMYFLRTLLRPRVVGCHATTGSA